MLIGLLGGRSYVQILYAYYYSSDFEHEYALWVVTFVPKDMGEVLLLVIMWIWYSFDILMRCMLSLLKWCYVNVDYMTLHPYLGLEEGIGK